MSAPDWEAIVANAHASTTASLTAGTIANIFYVVGNTGEKPPAGEDADGRLLWDHTSNCRAELHKLLALMFADGLHFTNPSFDVRFFLSACGVTDD